MNYRDIEGFKATLTGFMKAGCVLRIPAYGVSGRIVGIGYKPFWTSQTDNKIEKLEINFIDGYGRIIPFNFFNVIGYDIVSHDGQRLDNSKNISLDIHVFSPNKSRESEPCDKIRMEIDSVQEEKK